MGSEGGEEVGLTQDAPKSELFSPPATHIVPPGRTHHDCWGAFRAWYLLTALLNSRRKMLLALGSIRVRWTHGRCTPRHQYQLQLVASTTAAIRPDYSVGCRNAYHEKEVEKYAVRSPDEVTHGLHDVPRVLSTTTTTKTTTTTTTAGHDTHTAACKPRYATPPCFRTVYTN